MDRFDAAGVQILVVDPHESYRVRHMLKDSGLEAKDLHVPVLADPTHVVSATYGVAFQMRIHTEWSNRPATFIIDRQGIIRFAQRARKYSDRPNVEKLFQEVDKLAKRR